MTTTGGGGGGGGTFQRAGSERFGCAILTEGKKSEVKKRVSRQEGSPLCGTGDWRTAPSSKKRMGNQKA